jgi:hypothetical protein
MLAGCNLHTYISVGHKVKITNFEIDDQFIYLLTTANFRLIKGS